MKKTVKKIAAVAAVLSLLTGSIAWGGQLPAAKAAGLEINEENFGTDYGVLAAVRGADSNQDGILSDAEATKITSVCFFNATNDISKIVKYFPKVSYVSVNVGSYDSLTINHSSIKSLSVEAQKVINLVGCSSLTEVFYSFIEKSGKVDFSKAKGYSNVKKFSVNGSGLTDVVAPNQAKLTTLRIIGTKMSKIDTAKYKKVTTLDLSSNQLKSINVKSNKTLVSLACYNNKLSSLNISSNKNLKDIGVGGNKLTKIDTTKNQKMLRVVAFNNKIKSYPAASNKKLTEINLSCNKLTKLDVTKNKDLRALDISGNKIKSITLTKNKKLNALSVGSTSLKKLSLAKSVKLSKITVGTKYSLLKNVKFKSNTYLQIGMKLSGNKTYQLPKVVPALKGYTYSSYYDTLKIDKNGKFKMPVLKKGQYISLTAKKGKSSAYILLNEDY